MSKPICKNCKFQVDEECHRYPPHLVIKDKNILGIFEYKSMFPTVGSFWTCGEFKERVN